MCNRIKRVVNSKNTQRCDTGHKKHLHIPYLNAQKAEQLTQLLHVPAQSRNNSVSTSHNRAAAQRSMGKQVQTYKRR